MLHAQKPVKGTLIEQTADDVKVLRGLEAKIVTLQGQLKSEAAKRKSAESELAETRQSFDAALELKNAELPRELQLRPVKHGRGSPATAIICCNDWHGEANVEADLVNDLNHFNLDICRERVERLWQKATYLIDFARRVCDIRDIVLWLGGDLINGWIHEELVEGNFLGPVDAGLFVQELIVPGIEYLKQEAKLEDIRIECHTGNHGRSTHRRRIATAWKSSWEYMIYATLATRSWPAGVTWHVNRGGHSYVDVQGYIVRFQHGDYIRYNGGVGGISIPVNKAINEWNKSKRADYDVFGHWHQYIDTWRWTACGCLVGYDPFALSIKAEWQPPTQTLIVVDRERGKTMALPIFVD